MIVGSCPTDGGNFLLTATNEDLFKLEPAAEKWIRRYVAPTNSLTTSCATVYG